MFGPGIYFGRPVKAIKYTGNWGVAYLLEADVALGKSFIAPTANVYSLAALQAQGCHSIHGKARSTQSWNGTLAHDEWVVYSTEQIRLVHVHEYHALYHEIEVSPGVPCQRVKVPQVLETKGKRSFLDVLAKPRACGGAAHTAIKVAGGGEVWVCAPCLQQSRLRVGDRFQVMVAGKVQDVKIKG
jgi:hypothetical protein